MISKKTKNKIIKQINLESKQNWKYVIADNYLRKDSDEFMMNYMYKNGYKILKINLTHIVFELRD